MKTPPIPLTRLLNIAILAAVCLLPQAVDAKDKKKAKGKSHYEAKGKSHYAGQRHSSDNDRNRVSYRSHPRSGFRLSFGTGYAGRGYYYGPPNSPYYYERPEVRYYATRDAAPREYYSGGYNNSSEAAVQQALASRGYYQGSVDGQLGPQSRRAISRYQADRGLRVTGGVSSSLLHSLGL